LNSSVVLGVDLFLLLEVEDWADGPTEDTLRLAGEEARLDDMLSGAKDDNRMLSGVEDDEGMSNGVEDDDGIEVDVVAAMELTRCVP
jgi:hypothetical protein